METTKIFELAQTANYQEGAIVSTEVLKKKNGTVTLFAFDKGQGLSTHSAPFDAIVQVIEGVAEITIGEQEFEVAAGAGIIMPANINHAVKAVQPFKMMLIMIKE